MIMKTLVDLGLSNFYGSVILVQVPGKYYLTLDRDDSSVDKVEVSEELAKLIIKEFGNSEQN